jgi:hypothetical protein
MKKIIYNLLAVLILLTTTILNSCSEDPTASIYDVIEPAAPIPVERHYDFDDKVKKEVPYGITVDPQGVVYVSLNGQGIKKIVADTLAVFSPNASNAPFFKSITIASDSNIYGVRGGIKGIYKVVQNTAPATFVSSANGIADNVSDIEFDNARNVFWACGNEGNIYRITLAKNIKKYKISGNIAAVKLGTSDLFVALRDTNNQELIWKFPIVSADSLGDGELYFNFTQNVDSVAKITDIAIDQDGGLYICSNIQAVAMYLVRPDKSFSEFYSGLIVGSIYSFTWGTDTKAYFTNILVSINTDIWKVDMKKNSSQ